MFNKEDKIRFLKDYFSGNKTVLSFVKDSSQENSASTQNNTYRSSSPWYLLLSESSKFENPESYNQNKKLFSGYEFENNIFQKLFDAAFSKCFMFILDEEILDEDEIRERIINYLKSKKILDRVPQEIIKTLKKLDSETLDFY
jgi:hypothetical protein